MTTVEQIDITACEKEPIHIIGKIQGLGFLMVVNQLNKQIVQVSKNVSQFLNGPHDEVVGRNIGSVDIYGLIELIQAHMIAPQAVKANPPVVRLPDGQMFNLIINEWKSYLLLEFEPQVISVEEYNLQNYLNNTIIKVQSSDNTETLLNHAATEIKNMTGYDRVMIYKFHEDWHGEVVAEAVNSDMTPFIGLHYPASDIPKQARELFKLNPTRIIQNVNSESFELYPAIINVAGEPTDLTHSVLRASSPIHIQYLKNMGVGASLTISIVIDNKLWGLIACHHNSPKFIDLKLRRACEFLGQLLASFLQMHILNKESQIMEKGRTIGSSLVAWTFKSNSLIEGLTEHKSTIKDLINCDGAALSTENKIILLGDTPSEEQIEKLTQWLNKNQTENLFETDELSSHYKEAHEFRDKAAGLISIRLSTSLSEYVLWFRPEISRTVYWGGNPEKAVNYNPDTNEMTLTPRASFDKWEEIMKDKAAPWSQSDINSASKLRDELLQFLIKRANEIRKVNERLEEAYQELDEFSHTVSHDLRTPLTAVKAYSQILLSTQDINQDTRDLIMKISHNSDRMTSLIREILNYSKLGKVERSFDIISVESIIEEIIQDLKASYSDQKITFNLGNLPQLTGDQTMISQLFGNILSNAVKYSTNRDESIISVNGEITSDDIIYKISDNGIGINASEIDKVFQIFSRLSNSQNYEGSGVGMAIAKKIVDRHQGKIWIESEIGEGSTFIMSFPRKVLVNIVEPT